MSYSSSPTAYELVHFAVKEVRKSLAYKDVDSEDSWNYRYAGLCDEATKRFIDKMESVCARRGIDLKYKRIHGEQRHHIRLSSSRWGAQHTWCWVELLGRRYYVDCTCSQFQDWYSDIPDYYISMKKPKWFYPDRSNPVFNRKTRWLNERIVFKIKYVDNDGDLRTPEVGIIEIFQFEVWGRISDFIRKVLGKGDKK